jgi:hypothetical protein
VNTYLKDPAAYTAAARAACDHSARVNLENIVDCLTATRCTTFDDCIAHSRRQFEERFNHKIVQLVHMFPEGAKTSSGSLFWSPPKRFPSAVPFDAADVSHQAYIQASAMLFAQMYRLERPAWALVGADVAKRAAAVTVRYFRSTLPSCRLSVGQGLSCQPVGRIIYPLLWSTISSQVHHRPRGNMLHHTPRGSIPHALCPRTRRCQNSCPLTTSKSRLTLQPRAPL